MTEEISRRAYEQDPETVSLRAQARQLVERDAEIAKLKAIDASAYVDIVFDGLPAHESGRFIEVENAQGASIRFGEWIHRDDGFWVLRINNEIADQAEEIATLRADKERLDWYDEMLRVGHEDFCITGFAGEVMVQMNTDTAYYGGNLRQAIDAARGEGESGS